ncbi:MAG: N-acetylglucosamine-6-phosphate deacetylase [Chloroflexi bacterium]|nr:N-acetylglucosamine-6-phosphate deacetylase [Chloroflexota bacterium]MDL1883882.1 N-acetylglucosamine-6-phosphate deacetylase [Anaerolineae bacterium CFX8]
MIGSLLIHNARIMTPNGLFDYGWVYCEGRRIALSGVGAAPELEGTLRLDAGGLILLPGFIDVHVHGAVGHDTMDASPDGLRCMAQFYARHGVTGFLATTWADTRERIQAALETVAAARGPQADGATILGVHLEGPYLNPAKCGAQKVECIRRADPIETQAFFEPGVIRLLSLAPEYEENRRLIAECVRHGVTASAAHTGATYEDLVEAARLGLTHATHTFNAMTGFNHREPGAAGAVMTLPQIRCELIADGVHVHPAAMRVLSRVKGADGVVLVTDAVRCAGLPDGEYMLDARSVMVKDGAVRLPDGTLAGSILTMDAALRNYIEATGEPLERVWQACSWNAARAINLADRKGSLEVGKDADLALVDENINVCLTVAEGRVVYCDKKRLACS